MEDAESMDSTLGSSHHGKAAHPKKFAEPWVCLAKRVYLEGDTFTLLRQLKSHK